MGTKFKSRPLLPVRNTVVFPKTSVYLVVGRKQSLKALKTSQKNGGEIVVPKIPSYKILDVAKAINPNNKIKIIGIRPGEKIHEQMVSNDDAKNTLELKKYFLIFPSEVKKNKNRFYYTNNFFDKVFIKLNKKDNPKLTNSGFKYSSEKNKFLSVVDLKRLINKI